MKLTTILFSLLITWSKIAQAEIYEIKEMKRILPSITSNTLVIFDIDNTILRPRQSLGSDQWYGYEVKQLVQSGISEDQAISKVIPTWIQVQTKTLVEPVESQTPQLIQLLKANHISVMALTARPLELAKTTLLQLNSIKADIPYNPVARNQIQVANDPSTLFTRGILFVGPKNNKGEILKRFLNENRIKPGRIVFVDDKPHHVRNVETALLPTGLDYKGFRYGAADAWVAQLDPKITNRQIQVFKTTGELLSDEAATQK